MPPLFDCLCAGIIVADHVCAPIDRIPQAGGLAMADDLPLTIGGCAANVAVDLARLGTRVGIAGRVGQDIFGQYVRQSLEISGVDCHHLSVSSTKPTSGTLIINVRGQDRRFIHCVGANGEFDGRELTPALIRQCRILSLGGYCLMDSLSPERVAAVFRAAREAGVMTLLDVVIPGGIDSLSRLEPVLPWTDVFLPNDDEARLITGQADPIEQANVFCRMGARTVVITRGGRGAIVQSGPKRLRAGVYPVEFRDGTGSGDAFVAGYIHGLLRDGSLEECLRYGSALGASCVRATGATTGVFHADELEQFARAHSLPLDEF